MTNATHAELTMLLPWYVNGTLGAADRERVLEHLSSCADCRAEVSLCMDMQACVQQAGPTPILPATTAEQILDARKLRDAGNARWTRPQLWSAAAAVGFVAVMGLSALMSGIGGGSTDQPLPNQQFTAATAPVALPAVDYVLELQFAAGLSVDVRTRVIAEIGGSDTGIGAAQTQVRIVVRLAPKSLQELEQFAADIQSRREVISAAIIALQLPLR
ncbi:MAG: zf-HC2 domain-containing protein [Proteobacteria bacterium]|nr:zf-HC2 domain-containing protein [Pseudomonadota bacterium]